MPAYFRSLDLRCQYVVGAVCPKKATQEVRDTRNALQGRFCLRHAQELVATLNAPEVIIEFPHDEETIHARP